MENDLVLDWLEPRAPYLARLGRAADLSMLGLGWSGPIFCEDFPWPPAFFPVVHWTMENCYGFWLVDVIAQTGRGVHLFLDDPGLAGAALDPGGIAIVLTAVDTLRTRVPPERADALLRFVFPSSTSIERSALLAAMSVGDYERSDLRSLPLIDALGLPPDPPMPPVLVELHRRGERAQVGLPNPVSELDRALDANDISRAWDALNQPGWSYVEMLRALDRLCPELSPELASLLRNKTDEDHHAPVHGY